MSLTWGQLKKAIDAELEDDAQIKEIRVTEMYFRGVEICFDVSKNKYVIINKTQK